MSLFDAFSLREPVSTSLGNALVRVEDNRSQVRRYWRASEPLKMSAKQLTQSNQKRPTKRKLPGQEAALFSRS
jgi:hypothetical protein